MTIEINDEFKIKKIAKATLDVTARLSATHTQTPLKDSFQILNSKKVLN